MGEKAKTISFRMNEESFERLRELAETRAVSLSEIFRNYVHIFNQHDGYVEAVPEYEARSPETTTDEFPATTEVTTKTVREHERLELEVEHLREQLTEHERHVSSLERDLESREQQQEELILLDDFDTLSDFRFEEA